MNNQFTYYFNKYDVVGKSISLDDLINYQQSNYIKCISDKGNLPLYAISAIFDKSNVKKENVVKYTGYVGFDIDIKENSYISNIQNDLSEIYEYIVYASTTYSGGYRIIVKLDNNLTNKLNSNELNYTAVYDKLVSLFSKKTGLNFDTKCKDATRRYFLNYSENIIKNTNYFEVNESVIGSFEPLTKTEIINKLKKNKTEKKSTNKRNFNIKFDFEKVKIQNDIKKRTDHTIYLNVMPLYYSSKSRVGERNNKLCGYLLNYIAYYVFFNKKMEYTKILNYANYFNDKYTEQPLNENEIKSTVNSMYGSYINGTYTKEYLCKAIGVTYGNGYKSFNERIIKSKIVNFVKKTKKLNVTNTEIANEIDVSVRTLQRFLNKLFQIENLKNKLKILIELILKEFLNKNNNEDVLMIFNLNYLIEYQQIQDIYYNST